MAAPGLSLGGLGFLGAGLVLTYAGLNDPEGGPVGVVKALLEGRTPTPGIQTVRPGAAGGAEQGLKYGGPLTGGTGGSGGGSPVTGSRASVIAVAKTYLGVPYRLGSASRKGIDCSGLVLVSYRDALGIALPHKATLQMARGTRISRSEIQAGDLVGWGVPGNYPHIALAIDADTVIVAPTWGKPVQYQTLWQKKVPGFGYPDIVRIPDRK